jgi:hypothetical protein
MVKKYFILVLFAVNAIYAFADFWGSPEIIVTYSQNNEYMLKVYPIKFPDDFYSYKYQRQIKKGIAKDPIIVPCHAVLYSILDSDTIEIWNKPLVNLDSPVKAIVANDGKSVITIDDWHSKGYEHTFVIYGEGGELIKDFELKDMPDWQPASNNDIPCKMYFTLPVTFKNDRYETYGITNFVLCFVFQ